jgi:hypothetical protein
MTSHSSSLMTRHLPKPRGFLDCGEPGVGLWEVIPGENETHHLL